MASSSIIRLGPSDNNLPAKILLNAITSFFQKEDCDDGSGSRFVIENKYFNASIILKYTDDQQEEEALGKSMEDGIILVFDAVRSNPDRRDEDLGSVTTFDSLPSAHQKSLSNDACGDLLRLCVGVSLAELSPSDIRGRDHENEYSRRIMWCLDNGYEYVEADLSETGKQKGHDCRDKDGFARIVEAIAGTMWSSAVMSTSKSKKLKESFADSRIEMQENKKEEVKENKYNPPNPPQNTKQIDLDVSTLEFNDVKNSKNCTKEDSDASVFDLKERTEGMNPDDIDADKLFVQMESVLKEASQIREASKQGILSDDERRERAGDAALALVNLMGKFGLDNNDDYDESDDYNSDDSGIIDS